MPLLSFSTSSGVQLTASRTVNVLSWDVGTESACSNNGRPASKRRAFPYPRGGQGRCTTDLRPRGPTAGNLLTKRNRPLPAV